MLFAAFAGSSFGVSARESASRRRGRRCAGHVRERHAYWTDPTDEQWALIEPVILAWKAAHPSVSGHTGNYSYRDISARSSTRTGPAASGACCPTISRRKARSGTTSTRGATAVSTRRSTRTCAARPARRPAAPKTRGHGSRRPALLTSTKTMPNVMATIDPTTIPAGRLLFPDIVMPTPYRWSCARRRPGQAHGLVIFDHSDGGSSRLPPSPWRRSASRFCRRPGAARGVERRLGPSSTTGCGGLTRTCLTARVVGRARRGYRCSAYDDRLCRRGL